MSAYNHEEYVAAAIESIAEQNYDDMELIVVDDASPDGTAAEIERMAAKFPSRVKWMKNSANRGVVNTKNRALSLATGTLIMACGSDDLFPEGTVQSRAVNDFDLLLANGQLVTGREKLKHVPQFERFYTVPVDRYPIELILGNFIPAGAVTIRVGRIPRESVFEDPICPAISDLDLWLRLTSKYRWAIDTTVGWIYRWHGRNLSTPTHENHIQALPQHMYAISKCMSTDPSTSRRLEAVNVLCQLTQKLKTYEEERAVKVRNDLLAAARQAYDQNEFERAEQDVYRLVEAYPDWAPVWHLGGLIAFQQGYLTDAAESIERAIDLDPRNAEYCNDGAVVLLSLDRISEATTLCHRALANDSTYTEAVATLAELFRRQEATPQLST